MILYSSTFTATSDNASDRSITTAVEIAEVAKALNDGAAWWRRSRWPFAHWNLSLFLSLLEIFGEFGGMLLVQSYLGRIVEWLLEQTFRGEDPDLGDGHC